MLITYLGYLFPNIYILEIIAEYNKVKHSFITKHWYLRVQFQNGFFNL